MQVGRPRPTTHEDFGRWIAEVHHFWFEQLTPEDWFAGKPELDDLIWDRFGDLRQDLKATPPDAADLDGRGHVAAVIVFDQFSRNMFRRSSEAFATDAIALALSQDAIARNLDLALHPRELQFLYMPFMHAEDRALQAQSIELFARIGIPGVVEFAEQHKKSDPPLRPLSPPQQGFETRTDAGRNRVPERQAR